MNNRQANKNTALIMGDPASGKTASLRNLLNSDKIVYLNTDMKEIPFKSKMKEIYIDNALAVLEGIRQIEADPNIKMGILDTLTFLATMYEQQKVRGSSNGLGAWGDYGNFYLDIIHAIKSGTKDYVVLSHQGRSYNEKEMIIDVSVPIKGAIGKRGVEADFTTILGAKRMLIEDLKPWENDLLTFSDDELEDGFKYVFQTRVTKESMGEKMRYSVGLWNRKELYIDNDIQNVFTRLHEYNQPEENGEEV